MSLGKIRLNLYGLMKQVDCSVQLTLGRQDLAQIAVGLCVIRFNLEGLLKVLSRLREIALSHQGEAPMEVGSLRAGSSFKAW